MYYFGGHAILPPNPVNSVCIKAIQEGDSLLSSLMHREQCSQGLKCAHNLKGTPELPAVLRRRIDEE